jgi:antitoxin VapB
MLQTAKIFVTGRSQAARLPLKFRFDVPEVFIRHDPITEDVVLSRKPSDWHGLLEVVALNKDEEFKLERRSISPRRDPFEGSGKRPSAACSTPTWSATSCKGATRCCWRVQRH